MSLKEKLDALAKASAAKYPEKSQQIMKAATAKVADSIAERQIPQAGDPLPHFALPDSRGIVVDSTELARHGAFVLTFFRGRW